MRIRDSWFGRQLRRFARSNDGAAALEFALVLPPLCVIIVGMFEMSMLMFTQATLEGALREAARFGMTGSVADPADREDQILAIIDKQTLNLLDIKDATINFIVFPSFNDVSKRESYSEKGGDPDRYDAGIDSGWVAFGQNDTNNNGVWDDGGGVGGVGTSAQVVEYTVEYDWHVMTPFMAPMFGKNGKVHLKASVVLRNEPWDATTSSS
jgi:Flp pilus assembly pilin Flp